MTSLNVNRTLGKNKKWLTRQTFSLVSHIVVIYRRLWAIVYTCKCSYRCRTEKECSNVGDDGHAAISIIEMIVVQSALNWLANRKWMLHRSQYTGVLKDDFRYCFARMVYITSHLLLTWHEYSVTTPGLSLKTLVIVNRTIR